MKPLKNCRRCCQAPTAAHAAFQAAPGMRRRWPAAKPIKPACVRRAAPKRQHSSPKRWAYRHRLLSKKTAVVCCQGNRDKTAFKQDYRGLQSCAAANQLFGGPQACRFGCIGLGDCLAVCEYGAISIENGLADIDRNACTGCGKCVRQCPKGLITLTAEPRKLTVKCVNHDKGAKTRSVCTTGCIGCMKCVKACEHGAIKVEQFLATIDDSLCTACGKCAEVCPNGCIL